MNTSNKSTPPAAGEAAHTPLRFQRFARPVGPKGLDAGYAVRLLLREHIVADIFGLESVLRTDAGSNPTREEFAAFIVRACNSHDPLVDSLRGARAALMCFWHHSPTKIDAEIARIDAALKAAKRVQS